LGLYKQRQYKEILDILQQSWELKPSVITIQIFISKQSKRLLPVKRIINFAKVDVIREEYISRPVEIDPLE